MVVIRLEYMRFNRLAKDLGITDDQGNVLEDVLQKNLMFNTDKVGDTLHRSHDRSRSVKNGLVWHLPI